MKLPVWRFSQRHAVPHAATDVAVALVLKGLVLFAIYLLFFSPAHRPPADAAATADALMGKESPGISK